MTSREERIDAMARAIDPKAWPGTGFSMRREYARMSATAAYDALLAMGAIAEHSGEFVARIYDDTAAKLAQSVRDYGIGCVGADGKVIEPEQKD